MSGLTTSITADSDDISRWLITFVSLIQPRKFGCATLDVTHWEINEIYGQLVDFSFFLSFLYCILSSTKRMNLQGASTRKESKMLFGEAKFIIISKKKWHICASQELHWRTRQQLKGYRQKKEEKKNAPVDNGTTSTTTKLQKEEESKARAPGSTKSAEIGIQIFKPHALRVKTLLNSWMFSSRTP